MAGCPKYFLSKLEKVQNNATRLIFRTIRSAHVTPMLQSLHWLPIEQRVEYKFSLFCFKIISHQASIYLSELIHPYTPFRQLRSSTDTRVYRIPSFRTKSCGQHSFSYQAPVIWNQLPVSVCLCQLVLFNLPWKPFSYKKTTTLFPVPLPDIRLCVYMCVCVCARASARASTCVRAYVCQCVWVWRVYARARVCTRWSFNSIYM